MCRWWLVVVVAVVAAQSARAQLPGYEFVQITNTPGYFELDPRINDCGEVVYSRGVDFQENLEEIYLYDNGKTTRITNNNVRDSFPDINESGVLTWTRGFDGEAAGTIMTYDQGVVREIATGQWSTINSAGHLAYMRWWGTGCFAGNADIMLYDGVTIQMVSEGDLSNQLAAISDSDHVSWGRYNWCPWPLWESDIMLGAPGELTAISNDYIQPQNAWINNNDVVVWRTPMVGGPGDWIDRWQDGILTRVTDGYAPRLNDLDEIAFCRKDDAGVYHPWLYRDGIEIQVTDDQQGCGDQSMNNYSEIALTIGRYPSIELRLHHRMRTGDADFDGAIDLKDCADLVGCLIGPFNTDRLCACRFLDIDHDRDVDLGDFARFQNNFGSL